MRGERRRVRMRKGVYISWECNRACIPPESVSPQLFLLHDRGVEPETATPTYALLSFYASRKNKIDIALRQPHEVLT